jgi:hypothetical protein
MNGSSFDGRTDRVSHHEKGKAAADKKPATKKPAVKKK